MKCDKCESRDVLQVDISLGDGSAIHFLACGFCESKQWRSEEKPATLKEVLELATVHRPR